jgi:UDP-N-acetyl-D-mannosaminuronic acid dehydrogenase
MEKICVIGLGYIGLPTASMFATNGYKVTGVDVNETIVSTINNGDIHIEEPGLKTVVQAAINSGNLRASLEPEEADAFIITVPTPLKDNKEPDLSCVENATRALTPFIQKGNLIILESTSPPGTTSGLIAGILEEKGFNVQKDLFLAYCPERVLPGRILRELIENDRIIGGINRISAEKAAVLYRSFVAGEIYLTDAMTAEMVKLTENTFRDVNIALVNEIGLICSKIGVNVWEVIELANRHPRVQLHKPGPGVGGHCISVDPWFIIFESPEDAGLIKLARETNDGMPVYVTKNVKKLLKGISNPKVAVLGAAYKGNVDDVRESPARKIIDLLRGELTVSIYDPYVKYFEYELSGFEETLTDADLILVLVDHDEFRYIDPMGAGKLMRTKKIFDTRNCINMDKWRKAGFMTFLLGSGDRS